MGNDRYPLLVKKPQLFALSEKINGHRVFMYRDDPEDFGFGGNKVHFFEYLIPEILNAKPDILVTSGAMHSNPVRVTAQVAARLGIPCQLFLTEEALPDLLPGNIALAKSYGAQIQCIGRAMALLKIGEYVKMLEAQGNKVFWIPNGGHTPGAVRAYAQVLDETLEELGRVNVRPAAIYLPCASGTTHAGVLCAAAKRPLPPVVSIAVAITPNKAERGIARLIQSAAEYLPEGFAPGQISIQNCGKNDYGHPDEELLALRETLIRQDNVQLDPTYNINAFYGMIQALNNLPGTDDVLYINTGGYTELK